MKRYVFSSISAFLILGIAPSMGSAGFTQWTDWGDSTGDYTCEQTVYYEGNKATWATGVGGDDAEVFVRFIMMNAFGQGAARQQCADWSYRYSGPAGIDVQNGQIVGLLGECMLRDVGIICSRRSPYKCNTVRKGSVQCRSRQWIW